MPLGNCRLCGSESELQLSHIIPAFVFRWLRESAGNGFIRASAQPNLRVQDGPQEHWLCATCEGRFNRSETAFANNVFHPYVQGRGERLRYERWMLEFCTSLSWRVLEYQLSRANLSKYSPEDMARIQAARDRWRSFLLAQAPHPGEFRQHLVALDQIESTTVTDLPPNINRYLMRAIDIDVCHNDSSNTIFVFSKIGRFVIVGFAKGPPQGHWQGTRINANGGTVEPRQYVMPRGFLDYLCHKARRVIAANETISDTQRQKIEKTFRASVDRLVGSDFFTAMQADVEMFGPKAFSGPDILKPAK